MHTAPDPEPPEEPEPQRRPLRTLCPHCIGMGAISQPRLALFAESGYAVGVPETCPQCKGERWLPGLQSPM